MGTLPNIQNTFSVLLNQYATSRPWSQIATNHKLRWWCGNLWLSQFVTVQNTTFQIDVNCARRYTPKCRKDVHINIGPYQEGFLCTSIMGFISNILTGIFRSMFMLHKYWYKQLSWRSAIRYQTYRTLTLSNGKRSVGHFAPSLVTTPRSLILLIWLHQKIWGGIQSLDQKSIWDEKSKLYEIDAYRINMPEIGPVGNRSLNT